MFHRWGHKKAKLSPKSLQIVKSFEKKLLLDTFDVSARFKQVLLHVWFVSYKWFFSSKRQKFVSYEFFLSSQKAKIAPSWTFFFVRTSLANQSSSATIAQSVAVLWRFVRVQTSWLFICVRLHKHRYHFCKIHVVCVMSCIEHCFVSLKDRIFLNNRKQFVNSVIMSENIDEWILLRWVLILLRDKWVEITEVSQCKSSQAEHLAESLLSLWIFAKRLHVFSSVST